MDMVRLAVILVGALAAALTAPRAYACDLSRWQPHIAEASRRYAVPEIWIRAVMRTESAGCTHLHGRPITSSAGAMGLMQLMPATWTQLQQHHGLGNDPHDPRENILAGTAYLREMTDRFGVPGAFAAYHAGPGRYQSHLLHGAALPVETHRYLARVSAAASIGEADQMVERSIAAGRDALFAVVRGRRALEAHDEHMADPRLFVRLQRARNGIDDAASPPPEKIHAQP